MYGGKGIEYGSAESVFVRPEHPYTWGLLGSMPRMDRTRAERLIPIPGTPPSLINLPSGCAFHPRCAYADRTNGRSYTVVPELVAVPGGHLARCHLTVGATPRGVGDRHQAHSWRPYDLRPMPCSR